ncbi:MAG: hypothetical protein ACRDS0_35330, partial [Pseudonocardiaceae bacterium]
AGYPATVNQTRADLYLRLLDGTLDGQTRPQILTTMLSLGPLTPTDPDPERSQQPGWGDQDHEPSQCQAPHQPGPAEQPAAAEPPKHPAPPKQPMPPAPPKRPAQPEPAEQPAPAEWLDQPEGAQQPSTGAPTQNGTPCPLRYGIEVRVRLSTLLGLDDHPAELPGWGPIPAAAARDLVATQHHAEWRIAIVDNDGYLLHGEVKRFSYTTLWTGAMPVRRRVLVAFHIWRASKADAIGVLTPRRPS